MRRKSKRHRNQPEDNVDLTPMIDVTFQLLIFFILTMKIRQVEERQPAELPPDQGPADLENDSPEDFIVLRLFWRDGRMTYEVNFKHGNSQGRSPTAVDGGTMPELMADRANAAHRHYRRVYGDLMSQLRAMAARVPNARSIEIAMDQNTRDSSALHVMETSPMGFVTLALDVCTGLNKDIQNDDDKYGITIKNTEPAGPRRIG